MRRGKKKSKSHLELQGYDASKLQVFNRATNSFVDMDLYEFVTQPDTRSANISDTATNQNKLTQTLSKNQRLHSVNNKALTE